MYNLRPEFMHSSSETKLPHLLRCQTQDLFVGSTKPGVVLWKPEQQALKLSVTIFEDESLFLLNSRDSSSACRQLSHGSLFLLTSCKQVMLKSVARAPKHTENFAGKITGTGAPFAREMPDMHSSFVFPA